MLNNTSPTSGTTENLFEAVTKQWLTKTGSVIEEIDLVDEAAALRPDTGIAVAFLERLRPGGPWTLSAIVPDGMIHTITVRKTDEVAAFVAQHNGKFNLYYSVNPTRIVLTHKASKVDIAAIEYLPGDLDPKPDETTEAAKARYLAALKGHEPKPAAIIDSGNGINILLKLAQRNRPRAPFAISPAIACSRTR